MSRDTWTSWSKGAEARYFFSEESTSQGVTSKLNITGASRLDSTVFKCTASNAFGSDIKVVNVRVEESPEPPFDFQLESKSSRSVSLRWRSPYNGNSPLIEFMVNVKPEARDDNHVLASDFAPMANPGPERNITVSGNATSAIISHLQPATKYTFVAVSRNAVGASGPCKPLAVVTDEEAPGGSAVNVQLETLDATSIKVTWEPPRAELVNGVIKGYYIGYKVVNSSQHFVYKTVQSSIGSPSVGSIGPAIASSGLSLTLRALQPFTSYSIIVQAFNAVGAGPRTEEIRTRTGECGPSSPPLQVRCLPMSAQSLKVSWDPMGPERTNGFLRGYKLFYRPLAARSYGQLDQLRARTDLVRGDETNLILTDLLKYTNYSIRVAAFTTEDGPYSPDVQCRTNEDIPGPPQAIKVAQASGDSAAICWREPSTANGLVRSYTVYRKSWPEESVMSYTVPDHTKYYTSTGLIKGKRYSYWVTASTVIGEGPATPSFTQTSSDIGNCWLV
ncbi:Down syndrome cell adhesion molecule -like protein [Halotydeus destructor]|nr:Down syndrome cell adhesion molecule -like protein [Halotydeus destructor]